MIRREQLQHLRFDYEAQLFRSLLKAPGIGATEDTEVRYNLHKRYILGTSVKITPELFPDLYRTYRECLQTLGDGIEGSLYVHQSSDYNAQVTAEGRRFNILLTSALVKDLAPREVAFVIGHELGHVLFEHNRIAANHLLAEGRFERLSPQMGRDLVTWSRAAEISADRLGMLACGDLSSAANAFFKIASGIHLPDSAVVVRSLRNQFDEILKVTELTRNKGVSIYSHPLIPIRFKSLELISLDILAFRNSNKAINPRELRQINGEIRLVLAESEPTETEPTETVRSPELSQEQGALLILSLIIVGSSKGHLPNAKRQFIRGIEVRLAAGLDLEAILDLRWHDPDRFFDEALAELSDSGIGQAGVFQILRYCAAMCHNHGGMDEADLKAMQTLCQAMGGGQEVWHAALEAGSQ